MTARWGIYNQALWAPAPMEVAYDRGFALFTHESQMDKSDIWRGTGATKCPGMALARNAICSIGINAYMVIGGVKQPCPSKSGLYHAGFDSVAHGEYDDEINAWIAVLVAYKAEGGQVHALFHLEPSLDNVGQPTAGTSTEYKAAFAHVYPMFNAAGIELGWDSTSSDWRTGIALDWEPAVYDICSADFYPDTDITKTMDWGLNLFFSHAASAHPTNPVLVRSTTCKNFTDAQAATWFAQASDTLLAVPNLLGVGWDTDNQGLHILNVGETYPAYSTTPQTKLAFYNAAQDFGGATPPPGEFFTLSLVRNGTGLVRGRGTQVSTLKVRGRNGMSVNRGAAGLRALANLLPIGEVHQTLPPLTQSAAGLTGADVAGGVVQTLPHITQAATGVADAGAVIAQTLPHITQAATAQAAANALVTQILPALAQDAAGITGAGTSGGVVQTLPHITQAATAIQAGGAIVAQILPHLTQAATALRSDHSVIVQTLPALTQAATAFPSPGGPIVAVLPALVQAAIGGPPARADGSIIQTLPHLTQHASGFGVFDADPLYEPFVQPEAADNNPYAEVLV